MSPSTSFFNGPSTSSNTLNGSSLVSSKALNGALAKSTADDLEGMIDLDEDMECPLCLEEMDLSDLTFRPCPCGYQICRFCWHNIKENLNGRCPACRREYDDQPSQFKAMSPDEIKRLQNLKKQREKQKKDLEVFNRKNLANVRVRQKCQVHVQGMTARHANEETTAHLKGPEQFGQYGKISKLFMSKRSPTASTSTTRESLHPLNQPVHVYINFTRPVDAAACIAAVDGTTTQDGHRLKASWGTTKYCTTWLKGGRCTNENCVQAHELGEEVGNDKTEEGIKAREELSAVRHALKESEHKNRPSVDIKKAKDVILPPTVAWASKTSSQPTTPIVASATPPTSLPQGPLKRLHQPVKHSLPGRPMSRQSSQDKSSSGTIHPSSSKKEEVVSPPPISTPIRSPPPPLSPPPNEKVKISSPLSIGSSSRRSPPLIFPDLDFSDGSFSFNFDMGAKGKGKEKDEEEMEESNYSGSFDPFGDFKIDRSMFSVGSGEEDGLNRASRFTFARRTPAEKRVGSMFALTGSGRQTPDMSEPFAPTRNTIPTLMPLHPPPGMVFSSPRTQPSAGFAPLPPLNPPQQTNQMPQVQSRTESWGVGLGMTSPNGKGIGTSQHQSVDGYYASNVPGRVSTPFDQQPQSSQLPPGINVQNNGMVNQSQMMGQRPNGMPANFPKDDLNGYVKNLGVGRVNIPPQPQRAIPELPFQDPAIMRAFGHLPPHFANPPPPPNFQTQPLEQINQFGNVGPLGHHFSTRQPPTSSGFNPSFRAQGKLASSGV